MVTEYRIIFTATFDNTKDRDAVYDRLKTFMGEEKTKIMAKEVAINPWKQAHITADEYPVAEKYQQEAV